MARLASTGRIPHLSSLFEVSRLFTDYRVSRASALVEIIMPRISHGLIPSLESLARARDEIRQTNDEVEFSWSTVIGVGAVRIVAEMLIGLVRESKDSILRKKDWKPVLGSTPGRFTLRVLPGPGDVL